MATAVWLMDLSLLGGWLPAVVVVVACGALLFGVAWSRRALWHWIVVAAGALVAALIVVWGLDVPSRFGSTFPRSFVVWGALPLFALGAAVWQWRQVAWWRRAVALVAMPALASFGLLQINAHYRYLPTVGDLLGTPMPGQVDARQIDGPSSQRAKSARWVATTAARRGGVVTEIDIPAPVSHFHHRAAYVWLPQAYFSSPRPHLPVLMLISGTPGTPGDWLRAGGALNVANRSAVAHHGDAPMMVLPDANGSALGDSECVDGPRGRAETYLTVDVPAFVHAHFGASTDPHQWAIAGLSEGGTCALELAARHPDRFATFADFSGDAAPTLGSQGVTERSLYGGSWRERIAHDPTTWFAIDAAADVEGFVAVGSNDHGYVATELRLVDLAQRDHLRVRLDVIAGGGHNFRTWAHALRDAYPWIVERLQTPPTSTYNEVRATQPAPSSHPHRRHTTPAPRLP